MYIMG